MAIDDDAGLFFLPGRKDAIPVGIQQRQNSAKGVLTVVVRKHFGVDDRGIGLTKIFSKLHLRMPEVIVPHEPSNKTDNDRVSRSDAFTPAMLPKADQAESCFHAFRGHGFTADSRVYRSMERDGGPFDQRRRLSPHHAWPNPSSEDQQ